jgi:hypothetical protein
MTEQEKANVIGWDKIGVGNMFYKFEKDVRVILGITNWTLTMVEAADFNDKSKLINQPEFYAKVVAEAGKEDKKAKKCDKIIKTLSRALMSALKPKLQSMNPNQVVFLSIKRIGEGTKTAYDVELVEKLEIIE